MIAAHERHPKQKFGLMFNVRTYPMYQKIRSLVLEGDLSFGDLNLKAGDFHVATPSSSHPPGRTVNGCLVHVIMSLDQH